MAAVSVASHLSQCRLVHRFAEYYTGKDINILNGFSENIRFAYKGINQNEVLGNGKKDVKQLFHQAFTRREKNESIILIEESVTTTPQEGALLGVIKLVEKVAMSSGAFLQCTTKTTVVVDNTNQVTSIKIEEESESPSLDMMKDTFNLFIKALNDKNKAALDKFFHPGIKFSLTTRDGNKQEASEKAAIELIKSALFEEHMSFALSTTPPASLAPFTLTSYDIVHRNEGGMLKTRNLDTTVKFAVVGTSLKIISLEVVQSAQGYLIGRPRQPLLKAAT